MDATIYARDRGLSGDSLFYVCSFSIAYAVSVYRCKWQFSIADV